MTLEEAKSLVIDEAAKRFLPGHAVRFDHSAEVYPCGGGFVATIRYPKMPDGRYYSIHCHVNSETAGRPNAELLIRGQVKYASAKVMQLFLQDTLEGEMVASEVAAARPVGFPCNRVLQVASDATRVEMGSL